MLGIRRIVLITMLLGTAARAGDWHPNPDARYRLVISGSAYSLTDGDRRWADRFVANLRKRGGIVRSSEIARRYPSAVVQLNDAATTHRVFQLGDTSSYLALSLPIGGDDDFDDFLVDLRGKSVLAIGGIGTTTVHVHPSENFAVVVYSHAPVVYGIPVSAYSKATFEEQSATWLGGQP